VSERMWGSSPPPRPPTRVGMYNEGDTRTGPRPPTSGIATVTGRNVANAADRKCGDRAARPVNSVDGPSGKLSTG
jgi:hypothetical protein